MNQALYLAVIACAEAGERDLFVPGPVDDLLHEVVEVGKGAFTDRASDHAGLAEAASLRAAAQDLQAYPVMNLLGVRHDVVGRKSLFVQAAYRAFDDRATAVRHDQSAAVSHTHRVKRGHVNAFKLGEAAELPFTAFALSLTQHLSNFDDHVFTVADHKRIDEIGERLGIEHAGPAGQDNRIVIGTVVTENGNAAHLEHVENVGVGELPLKREADCIEFAERSAALHAEERHAAPAELSLHVDVRRKGPLGPGAGIAIENVIENLQPQIAEPDIVAVRKRETDAQVDAPEILMHRVELCAEIAARLLNDRQDL